MCRAWRGKEWHGYQEYFMIFMSTTLLLGSDSSCMYISVIPSIDILRGFLVFITITKFSCNSIWIQHHHLFLYLNMYWIFIFNSYRLLQSRYIGSMCQGMFGMGSSSSAPLRNRSTATNCISSSRPQNGFVSFTIHQKMTPPKIFGMAPPVPPQKLLLELELEPYQIWS